MRLQLIIEDLPPCVLKFAQRIPVGLRRRLAATVGIQMITLLQRRLLTPLRTTLSGEPAFRNCDAERHESVFMSHTVCR